MAIAQVKSDALAARLASLSAPVAGFTATARAEANARLATMGLPVKRDEYWRYTDPAVLSAVEPTLVADAGVELELFDDIDALKLVFVDGVFDAAQSGDLASAGVELSLLSQADQAASHWAGDVYGVLEARAQVPVARPLAALNTAYAVEGVLIRATGKAVKPVSILYQATASKTDVVLHHVVKLEEGAEITILEQGLVGARSNVVMEVDVADGARFHHIRAQGRQHDRHALTHVFARLGANALVKSFTLTANGALTRNEAILELVGDDSQAHVGGAALGNGADFRHDDTVFVTHAAERCESRQVFKKVLRNAATGVFQGKILVKQGAQKTDGYQISQSLLLDGDSQFLAKPELEIYADDVKCSHGSTSGAIDDTALFYLQSRGLPKRTATSLLVLAFLAETLEEIEDEAIAENVRDRLELWLHSQEA